ncbi:DegT/DnrJ/EryC1/StrS aminotransferase family protein [Brucepastera parasyntrophica]|uniref:DegT/DnrJ/EryC1/StrS family aminotransferase n=1 Tax=Brucepastera parasyntrophica TaxID=2880008 RepID=UPI00210B3040|nr:DegT/DnrJ/EryC1/StrS aminotransferase family protein [Brucepastera parasyntrophica]ULQ60093.1 DegT/DnrJ/EryC1/StrS aminotransferase family protein [Brucepastera parasyntrophica]
MNEKPPAEKNIPFFKPSFSEKEEEAVIRVIRSGWLTTGKETLDFEREFSGYTGSPFSLAVNSASSGLLLAMEAFGVGSGKKILTTPYTFVSTATSARHLNAEIVYADIEPDSYNIDPEKIETVLRKDSSIAAIVPVHIAGEVCNMRAINEIASRFNVPVIEDSAHAFPARTPDGLAGTLGDAGVFSFYATKTITTGEGGMVCVRDSEKADRIKIMRSNGINRIVWDRYTNPDASWKYDVVDEGWKCNLPDILAAIGRVQLTKADTFFKERKALAEMFNTAFSRCEFFQLPPDSPGNAWHLYLLRIVPEKLTIDRDDFMQILREKGLGVSMHFIPHFEMSYFKDRYGLSKKDFPEADKKYRTTISLPFWPGMPEQTARRIIDTVIETGNSITGGAYDRNKKNKKQILQ